MKPPNDAPSAAPDTPVIGILCPTPGCGTRLDSVLFTRPIAGQILRVRKCEKCRRRVRTSERVVCTNVPGRGEDPSPPAAA